VAGLTACGGPPPIAVSPPLTVPFGDYGPRSLTITPDGARVLVDNGSEIEVLDTATNARLGAYGESSTWKPVLAPDGKRLYFTTSLGLEAIDLVSGLILEPSRPGVDGSIQLVAVTADGQRFFGYAPGPSPALSEVNLTSGAVRTIAPLPDGSSSVVVTPDGSRAYATSQAMSGLGQPLKIIDTATGRTSDVPDAGGTLDIALGPDGHTVYAIGYSAALVIDAASGTITRRVPISLFGDFVVSPDRRHLFVAEVSPPSVRVFDMDAGAVVATVPIPETPMDLAVTPDGRRLYVASGGGLTIVNLAPPE
jgi:DNA-binding beta-propeller fold protein YncE